MKLLDLLRDRQDAGVEKMMDLTWKRNEALTSNIVNSQTPGYRAVDLSFASELEQAFKTPDAALARTSTKHLTTAEPQRAHLVSDLSGTTRADGNNVDLDMQMARLTHNQGRYSLSSTILRKKYSLIRQAIREGQR